MNRHLFRPVIACAVTVSILACAPAAAQSGDDRVEIITLRHAAADELQR